MPQQGARNGLSERTGTHHRRFLPMLLSLLVESHCRPGVAGTVIRGGPCTMHEMWKDMFVLAVPVLEKILRPVIVYIFLVLMLRLSGKRELVQLNPFDLVVLLTLSNTVQNAIIGEDNSVLGGIIGATSLLVTNFLVVRFLYNHWKIERAIEGHPVCLIEHGKVKELELRKELISISELRAAAHR